MTETRKLHLGASIRGLGYHGATWRHPDVDPTAALKIDHFIECARIAEDAKFDVLFLADILGIRGDGVEARQLARSHDNVQFEPITLLSALSVTTKKIGLVTTLSTSYNEPFHVARKLASLDHLSGGRAGWNVVTSWSDVEAANFSAAKLSDKKARYDRAAEFIDVVEALWESWDSDAFLYDKASGVFFDPEKLHVLNHKGTYFNVKGPLNIARPPQGRPAIFQAGASTQGIEFAAKYADVVYSVPHQLGESRDFRDKLRATALQFGRTADSIKLLPGIHVVVGRTEREAREKLALLREIVDPITALSKTNIDLGRLDGKMLDAPLTDEVAPNAIVVASSVMNHIPRLIEKARAEGWTLRQLAQQFGIGPHRFVVGTPGQIADDMQSWFEQGGCDGFNILPTHLPAGLGDFAEMVVPILQERGLFRREYQETTLRGHLGVA